MTNHEVATSSPARTPRWSGRLRGSLCLLVALAGCGGPAPSLRVVSSQALGVMPQDRDIVGRDGGASALCFGRSVWAFGDTVLHHSLLADPG